MQPVQIGGFDVGTVVVIDSEKWVVVESSEDAEARDSAHGQWAIKLDNPIERREVSPSNEHDLSPLTKIRGYSATLPLERVEELRRSRDRLVAEEVAEREQAQSEYRLKLEQGRKIFERLRPAWAKAAIAAIQSQDKSDPMSDYFSSVDVRAVLLGWSKSTRNDFRELHRMAALLPETAKFSGDPRAERRENYAMGDGLYLGDYAKRGGWRVQKIRFDFGFSCDFSTLCRSLADGNGLPPEQIREEGAEPVTVEGVMVRENKEKDGIEVVFASKPAPEVLKSLKAGGFRWSRGQGLWWAKRTAERLALAKNLQR
jgi:hypothetical protein